MVEFCNLFIFGCPSERNYKIQFYYITLYWQFNDEEMSLMKITHCTKGSILLHTMPHHFDHFQEKEQDA